MDVKKQIEDQLKPNNLSLNILEKHIVSKLDWKLFYLTADKCLEMFMDTIGIKGTPSLNKLCEQIVDTCLQSFSSHSSIMAGIAVLSLCEIQDSNIEIAQISEYKVHKKLNCLFNVEQFVLIF